MTSAVRTELACLTAAEQAFRQRRYCCGGCGEVFATKGEKKRHKQDCIPAEDWGRIVRSLEEQAAEAIARRPDLNAEWLDDATPTGAKAIIAQARAEMGPERWKQLNEEWLVEGDR